MLEVDPGTTGFGISKTCGAGLSRITQTATGAEAVGGSRWSLRAPEGTFIRTLTGAREQTTWQNSDIVWEVRSDAGRLDRIATSTPGGPVGYAVNSHLVFAGLVCARRPCLPPPSNTLSTSISLKNLVATLEDEVAPEVVIDPTQLVPATVRGTIEIPFIASDGGAGFRDVFLLVDGRIFRTTTDFNGGKCTLPLRFLVPCKLDLNSSIFLDTTVLSEGRHEVKLEVKDISGLTGESETFSIDVRNAPVPGEPPNANPAQMADRTAPVLSGAALSRKRFRVGKARTALIAAASAVPGTVLRFASTEAGALSLAIAKAKSGAKPIATLMRSISAGPGKVPLSGRIGKKPLRPGRYRLILSARDAVGNASAPVTLPFAILPPAR